VDGMQSEIARGGDMHAFEQMLGTISAGLSSTLDTVLSQVV